MRDLPVYETFYTWQGEGCHMGKPAFFIRLFGCPVHCPWCDSAGTWHPDHIPETIDKRSISALVSDASQHNSAMVVITGGEPCIHDLKDLTQELQKTGKRVHLETSGAFPIKGSFDWITLSPKIWKKPIPSCLEQADEYKIIVDSLEAIDVWETEISVYWKDKSVWLHPEWSKRNDPSILNLINGRVKESKQPYRAGFQIHKLYQVDEEDERSKPTIQLQA
jgi:7-carboxy-7-deazaguanine synthase